MESAETTRRWGQTWSPGGTKIQTTSKMPSYLHTVLPAHCLYSILPLRKEVALLRTYHYSSSMYYGKSLFKQFVLWHITISAAYYGTSERAPLSKNGEGEEDEEDETEERGEIRITFAESQMAWHFIGDRLTDGSLHDSFA